VKTHFATLLGGVVLAVAIIFCSWTAASDDGGSDLKSPIPDPGICRGYAPIPPFERKSVSLPADDASHATDVDDFWEFWLWTGHFTTTSGRHFGFSVAFEQRPALHIQKSDYTLMDLDRMEYHYGRTSLIPGNAPAVENGFSLHGDHSSAVGGNGREALHEDLDGFSVDVNLQSTAPPVLLGDEGQIQILCNNLYGYQRQRIEVTGTIAIPGENDPVEVAGEAWLDHDWGFVPLYQLAKTTYINMHLDDGRKVFLAGISFIPSVGPTRAILESAVPSSLRADYWTGLLTDENGSVSVLHRDDFTLTPTGEWQRDALCSYPLWYDVDIRGMKLTIAPVITEAELRLLPQAPINAVLWGEDAVYWTGVTNIDGDAHGIGWLDHEGYCYE